MVIEGIIRFANLPGERDHQFKFDFQLRVHQYEIFESSSMHNSASNVVSSKRSLSSLAMRTISVRPTRAAAQCEFPMRQGLLPRVYKYYWQRRSMGESEGAWNVAFTYRQLLPLRCASSCIDMSL